MFFKEELEEMLSYYRDLVKDYNRVISNSPDGSLYYQKKENRIQFLYAHSVDGKKKREGINHKTELIKALARKKFAEKSLKIIEANVDSLQKCIDSIKPFDCDEVVKSMGDAYSLIPNEFFFDRYLVTINLNLDGAIQARVNRHREWGNAPYNQSNYMVEMKKNVTSRGIRVRSKSEALITEMLYRIYDIPNHYEQVQTIDGITICPDFTFEDSEGKLFYWEHLGMMDNPEYAERNLKKLNRYYNVGIVPGDNLILSFDRKGKIDMKYIEGIIMNEVIPRL